ncbi:MAG: pyrroline-5-carboxylate reductase [Desulfitobacteriaceae bacterium]
MFRRLICFGNQDFKMLQNIGFIGAGNLAEAVIKGLTAGAEKPRIMATDLSKERLSVLEEKYGVLTGELAKVVEESEVIVIAVKPKDVATVVKSLATFSIQGKLVISVAAGIPLAMLENSLPGVAVVRVMPNTSCAVLLSMTGMVQGSLATEKDKSVAEDIFCRVGQVLWVEENKINAVTAISGSGPAYYYLFTECLAAAGVELGLTTEEARVLAQETFAGASQMLVRSGKTPTRLREDVTSPNGTTYAALQQFEQAKLKDIVQAATKAAAERAAEMERDFGG